MASSGEAPNIGDLIKALFLFGQVGACCECGRLNKRTNPDNDDWIIKHLLMIPVAAKCPDCQTPEERAECAIRQASGTTYHLEGIRLVQDPEPEDKAS